MKKALALLVALAMLAVGAASAPYFEYDQYILPDETDVGVGTVSIGWAFSLSQVYEYPCPKETPCGGEQQFGEISVSGDLHFGIDDIWVIPGAPFVGLNLDLRWSYVGLSLSSKLGFTTDWSSWPYVTSPFDYWDSTVEFAAYVTDWFRFWLGADLTYDSHGAGYLEPWPYMRFRLGDQG